MEKTYTIELNKEEIVMIRLALLFRADDLKEAGRSEKAEACEQLRRRFILTELEATP